MNPYKPKRKEYSSLTQLHDEMISKKVKILSFDGAIIITKTHSYSLYDSVINTKITAKS